MNCPVDAVCAVPTTPFLLPRTQRLMCELRAARIITFVRNRPPMSHVLCLRRSSTSSACCRIEWNAAARKWLRLHSLPKRKRETLTGQRGLWDGITATRTSPRCLPTSMFRHRRAQALPLAQAHLHASATIYAWRIHQAPSDPFNERALICRLATRLSMKALLASSCHASTACKLLSRETGYRYEPLTDDTQLWFLCPILIDFGTPTCPLSLPVAQQRWFVTTLQLIQAPLSRTCAHVAPHACR